MSIALATTSITIRRPTQAEESVRDRYERDDPATAGQDESAPSSVQTLATEVPADISVNQGRSGAPGDTQTIEFLLICDPTDLSFRDLVIDERSGAEYSVSWAILTGSFGFEHIQAGLKSVSGFGNE